MDQKFVFDNWELTRSKVDIGKVCFAESREDPKKYEFFAFKNIDIWSKTSYSNHQFINEAFTNHLLSIGIQTIIFIDDLRVNKILRKELKRILKKINIPMVINNREEWVKKDCG